MLCFWNDFSPVCTPLHPLAHISLPKPVFHVLQDYLLTYLFLKRLNFSNIHMWVCAPHKCRCLRRSTESVRSLGAGLEKIWVPICVLGNKLLSPPRAPSTLKLHHLWVVLWFVCLFLNHMYVMGQGVMCAMHMVAARRQLCGVHFLLPSSCGYQVCRLVWQCLSTRVLGVFFLLVCFTVPTFWKFWSLTYISVFVWWCAYGSQKRLLDLLELILNEALSHLMWVLGCKLEMRS